MENGTDLGRWDTDEEPRDRRDRAGLPGLAGLAVPARRGRGGPPAGARQGLRPDGDQGLGRRAPRGPGRTGAAQDRPARPGTPGDGGLMLPDPSSMRPRRPLAAGPAEVLEGRFPGVRVWYGRHT